MRRKEEKLVKRRNDWNSRRDIFGDCLVLRADDRKTDDVFGIPKRRLSERLNRDEAPELPLAHFNFSDCVLDHPILEN